MMHSNHGLPWWIASCLERGRPWCTLGDCSQIRESGTNGPAKCHHSIFQWEYLGFRQIISIVTFLPKIAKCPCQMVQLYPCTFETCKWKLLYCVRPWTGMSPVSGELFMPVWSPIDNDGFLSMCTGSPVDSMPMLLFSFLKYHMG